MVVAATVHKILASWQWTLLATIVVAGVISLAFGILMGSSVTALVATAQEMLTAVKSQGQDAQLSFALTESMLLGLGSDNLAIGSIMSLALARWWQAGYIIQVVFKMNSTASYRSKSGCIINCCADGWADIAKKRANMDRISSTTIIGCWNSTGSF